MKKLIGLFIFILCVFTYLFQNGSLTSFISTVKKGNTGFINAKKKEKIYILETERFINFPIPDALEGLRLSLRPVLKKAFKFEQETLLYKIHYRLESKEEKVIEERDYWVYHDIDPELVIEAQKRFFYEKKDLQPIHPKPIFLPLGKKAREGKLFIKLITPDPNVVEVLVNTKYKEKFPDYRKRPGWERMPKHLKKAISEENLYRLRHLSKKEQNALTLNKWRPIAPNGIPQEDFEENLFFEDTEWVDDHGGGDYTGGELPEDGIVIGPQRNFLGTLPADGDLKLEFFEIRGQAPQNVTLRWFGREVYEIESENITVDLSKPTILKAKSGIVEIFSDDYIFLKAARSVTNKNHFISMTVPKSRSSFLLTESTPLFFKVEHNKNNISAYKFDFKSRFELERLLTSKKIKIEELSESKKLIKTHASTIPPDLSFYDFDRKKWSRRFTKPHSVFIYPNIKTHFFKVSGDLDTMVNLYSRLKDHRKVNFVPNDFFRPIQIMGDEPGWFSTFPLNKDHLSKNGRVAYYRSQRQAPERKDYLIQGLYDLVPYRPVGKWSAQFFLMKMRNPNYSPEANSFTFGDLPTNKEISILFSSKDLKSNFKPLLIVNDLPSNGGPIEVYIDQKLIIKHVSKSKSAHITLPLLRPGAHKMKINAPQNTSAFLNYHLPSGDVYLKKIAYRLDKNQKLKFEFDKRTPQETNLSFRVFQNNLQASHIQIKSNLTDLRKSIEDALDSATLPFQEWNIGPDPKTHDFIFNNFEQVNSGAAFPLFFGHDFSQKKSELTLELKEGDKVFIGVFELAPKGEIEYNDSTVSPEEAQ